VDRDLANAGLPVAIAVSSPGRLFNPSSDVLVDPFGKDPAVASIIYGPQLAGDDEHANLVHAEAEHVSCFLR